MSGENADQERSGGEDPRRPEGGALGRDGTETPRRGELICQKYQQSRSSSPSTTKAPTSPVP